MPDRNGKIRVIKNKIATITEVREALAVLSGGDTTANNSASVGKGASLIACDILGETPDYIPNWQQLGSEPKQPPNLSKAPLIEFTSSQSGETLRWVRYGQEDDGEGFGVFSCIPPMDDALRRGECYEAWRTVSPDNQIDDTFD